MRKPGHPRIVSTLLLVAGVIATVLFVAPVATAAPTKGWVYISAPTWMGNCAGGKAGKMVYMQGSAGDTWNGGDAGDDLLYVRVDLNAKQSFSYSGFCSRGRIPQPGVQVTIKPTRNNQTIFVGPAGVRY